MNKDSINYKDQSEISKAFDNITMDEIGKAILQYERESSSGNLDTKQESNKNDLFSNNESKPSNIKETATNNEYPAMDGLIVPNHLNNPDRVAGNGRGSAISAKNIIKNGSVLKKQAFSAGTNSSEILNQLISAVMSDTQLDYNQKSRIVDALKAQSPVVLATIKDHVGILFGAGAGLAIAKFLFGAGFGGQLMGSIFGAYLGNNIQNRLKNPLNNNPFSGVYNPGFTNNPFI